MAPRPTPNITSDNDDRRYVCSSVREQTSFSNRNKDPIGCTSYAPCGIETNPDRKPGKSTLMAEASARGTAPVPPDSGEQNRSQISERKHSSQRERRTTTFRKRRLQNKQRLSLEHFFADQHQELVFRFGSSYRDFVVPQQQQHQASEEESG